MCRRVARPRSWSGPVQFTNRRCASRPSPGQLTNRRFVSWPWPGPTFNSSTCQLGRAGQTYKSLVCKMDRAGPAYKVRAVHVLGGPLRSHFGSSCCWTRVACKAPPASRSSVGSHGIWLLRLRPSGRHRLPWASLCRLLASLRRDDGGGAGPDTSQLSHPCEVGALGQDASPHPVPSEDLGSARRVSSIAVAAGAPQWHPRPHVVEHMSGLALGLGGFGPPKCDVGKLCSEASNRQGPRLPVQPSPRVTSLTENAVNCGFRAKVPIDRFCRAAG